MGEPTTSARSSLRAVAHPVRLRILSLLTGSAMSAAELGRELGLTHANASYHLRVLVDAGEAVEAGEQKIRGGVAKRYQHPWERDHDERRATAGTPPRAPEDGALYIRAMAEELVRRFSARARQPRSMLTDAEMWVDPEVWDEVVSHVAEASRLIHSGARPPRTPGTVHVNLTAAAFALKDVAE